MASSISAPENESHSSNISESEIIFVAENELDVEINSDDLIYADEFDELVGFQVIIVVFFFYIVVLQLNLDFCYRLKR